MGLWLDSLFNTILGSNAEHVVIYKTFSILICIVSYFFTDSFYY